MSKDYSRLDKNNAAVLLVDHQAGLLSLVRDIEPDKFKNNVLALSYLFYQAEKGHNPKVESYYDALVYISTCMSVGYADIFAKTSAGLALTGKIASSTLPTTSNNSTIGQRFSSSRARPTFAT